MYSMRKKNNIYFKPELVGDPEKTHFLIGLSDYKTKGAFRWLDETNEVRIDSFCQNLKL